MAPHDSDSEDDRVSDWASSLGDARRTTSLFDTTVHASPEAALAYDRATHGFDLRAQAGGSGVYGWVRLVNWIRKERPTPKEAREVNAEDDKLKDDKWLIPVLADDPLLQLGFDDWSDDEDDVEASTQPASSSAPLNASVKLEALRRENEALKGLLARALEGDADSESGSDDGSAGAARPGKGKGKGKGKERDDDTHYFDSYAENDIHEIMLRDTARTVSYGRFLLSNPQVFKGAVVLDVGCGTAILSMLAARAGAKHVYAIEASGLAVKARENVLRNGLADVVTVIQGKVENITLPVDKVDVIVSEWMGYMLLYESMLDSVLHARDRFLTPDGLMAPSQTRLVITAITADRLWRERVDFWRNVYGFNMSGMVNPYFAEGLVEVVDADEVVTTECIVRDINTHTATPASLDFTSPFTLTATAQTTVRAFLTHFDTFFSPVPGQAGHVAPASLVDLGRFADNLISAPIAPVSADAPGAPVSFTTGPRGQPTHWKQVAFLLREPFALKAGDTVEGTFVCKKSETNSRELDVEIRWVVDGKDMAQAYRVR
ncbi:hypothetical protein Q5752_000749 [Cryptotrichosporon argae]